MNKTGITTTNNLFIYFDTSNDTKMKLSALGLELSNTRGGYLTEDGASTRLAAMVNIVFGDKTSIFIPRIPRIIVPRAPFIPRRRKPLKEIFLELGPRLTRRAYRMTEESFYNLLRVLEPYLKDRCSSETPDGNSKKKHKNGAKNGLIPLSTRLSVALRFYAGGRPTHNACAWNFIW